MSLDDGRATRVRRARFTSRTQLGNGSWKPRLPAEATRSSSAASCPRTGTHGGAAYGGLMSIVKINAISVPTAAAAELERRFSQRAGVVDRSPGFLGFQLLRPVQGDERYFVVTQWEDEESYAAWRDGDARAAHKGEHGAPVATAAELLEFEVVLDVRPAGG